MNYVRVGGYIPPQPIEDYNDLPNIPVISQDLTASGFTPIANTYYKHTGATTASYTNGVIYYYNSTGYIALDGSAYGLATVAKTGSYNDLSNKPTIPDAANNGTLTIQKNGTNVATFGANQSTNTTANITVPTKASDIEALSISGGSITGNLTVGGNLTINGTTTTVDSTTLQVKDKLIEVAHGNTEKLTTPAGLVAPKYDGANSGALVFDGDGIASVGDVVFDTAGNIDVAKSDLQPLATRDGLVGGNLVQYDSSALTLKDSGKKIGDLALKTDLSGKANLSGGNTFSGNQVITGYLDIRGTAAEKHLKTRGIGGSDGNGNSSDLYLQYSSNYKTYFGKTAQSSLNADGSISINGKTAATTDQIPPAANNGMLTIQKNGTDVATFTANQKDGTTANITVPTSIDGLGGGTLTSPLKVAGGDGANAHKISLDNSNNGQITDKSTATLLGFTDTTNFIVGHKNYGLRLRGKTVRPQYTTDNVNYSDLALYSDIPDISGKLDKTKYEVNKTINFGQDGALYIGKFKVYDTNVTCEITSTTSVTYSGKLVIAAQNYVIREAKVYGDAANTVAPNIYIKPSSGSDQYIEVYFKPESWSKNVIHIYGSNIQAEPTDVCTSIPSVPSTATLKPTNALPIYSLSGTTFTITF